MKIFDCFMYFDEEMILDLRLNILDKYVDYFVVVESKFTHSGKARELKFNIEKFNKFRDKIIYLIHDEIPKNIISIKDSFSEIKKIETTVMNAVYRENSQRNHITKGLDNAENEDLILISDVDEIPNLKNFNFEKIKKKNHSFQSRHVLL